MKTIPKLRFKEFREKWGSLLMREISSKITDGTHDTPKQIGTGVPYLTAIHIKDGNIDYASCYFLDQKDHDLIYKRCNPEKGDLLIVNIGSGTATCASVTVDYEFSLKNVALIKPNRSIVFPDYLSQFQRKNSKRLFLQLTSGGAQPFLSLKEIGKLKVSLPSLPEQQKIASFLSAVDEKIQQLTRKKELLEQYKKGVMQRLFCLNRDSFDLHDSPDAGTNQSNQKNHLKSQFRQLRFKDENGKLYPKWEEKRLGDVAIISMGQSPDSTSYNSLSIGMLLIQGNADISGRVTNPRQWTSEPTKTCEIGDLILTVRAPVGSISKSLHNACIGRGVCAIKNNSFSKIEYLFQFLVYYEDKWKRIEQGSTFTAISGDDIKSIKMELPILGEQQKIANFLTALDAKIETVAAQIAHTQTFKKGLLQQMFV